MARHLDFATTHDHLAHACDSEAIADAEGVIERSALDRIYAIRSSLPKHILGDEGAVRTWTSLAKVERALRALETSICGSGPSATASHLGSGRSPAARARQAGRREVDRERAVRGLPGHVPPGLEIV
jgi:hypothetical protein